MKSSFSVGLEVHLGDIFRLLLSYTLECSLFTMLFNSH